MTKNCVFCFKKAAFFCVKKSRAYLLLLPLWALLPGVAHAWPWSDDMANQPNIKPQEGSPKLYDKRAVPVTPAASLPRATDREAVAKLANPIAPTPVSIAAGARMFEIYCVACHGKSGTGDGLVGEKLVLKPFDLTTDTLKAKPDSFIFGYMTFGGAVMPNYANDLSVEERWHVVNYVRNGLKKPMSAVQNGAMVK